MHVCPNCGFCPCCGRAPVSIPRPPVYPQLPGPYVSPTSTPAWPYRYGTYC